MLMPAIRFHWIQCDKSGAHREAIASLRRTRWLCRLILYGKEV
jgi:hypothetical protein